MKYPRTSHLPTSPGMADDDRRIPDLDILRDSEIVVTEKMDGENTTMTRDRIHARSLDSDSSHPSRHLVTALWGKIRHEIPETWRICGENLYARHSIAYENLPGVFMIFNVWDGPTCLSWDDTVEIAGMLGLPVVPVLHRGVFDLRAVTRIAANTADRGGEGIVVRVTRSFPVEEFSRGVAKWVREGHVQTQNHWMHQAVIPNGIARR